MGALPGGILAEATHSPRPQTVCLLTLGVLLLVYAEFGVAACFVTF